MSYHNELHIVMGNKPMMTLKTVEKKALDSTAVDMMADSSINNCLGKQAMEAATLCSKIWDMKVSNLSCRWKDIIVALMFVVVVDFESVNSNEQDKTNDIFLCTGQDKAKGQQIWYCSILLDTMGDNLWDNSGCMKIVLVQPLEDAAEYSNDSDMVGYIWNCSDLDKQLMKA